ncbi:MAG: hypothetical protein K1Y01_16095 [Vicinamibacteria bacterium]|nr:hypothetical protein [Vicinamibacteria bacterium]
MFRNILGIVVGFVLGNAVNIAMVTISSSVVAPPEGADMTTVEGLKAAMPRLEAKHFLFPFLAHALGTLVASLVAATIASSHKMTIAMAFGILFLCGGIAASVMIPAPPWFVALDLIAAYVPMAWLGGKLGKA